MLQNVGLGILNWKCYDTLRASLESYKLGGLLDLFEEKVIYFNEVDSEAISIAEKYGFKSHGTPENLGIYGGFKGLAKNMQSKYVLLLENDLPIIESAEVAYSQLSFGIKFLQSKKVPVVYYRSLKNPGAPVPRNLYRNFYPPANSSFAKKVKGFFLRLTRPSTAKRYLQECLYHENNPTAISRYITKDSESGFYILAPKCHTWINLAFLIEKSFFENNVLHQTEIMNSAKKRVQGNKSIEAELNKGHILNRGWWRKSNFSVAYAPGLFTHNRIGYKGY